MFVVLLSEQASVVHVASCKLLVASVCGSCCTNANALSDINVEEFVFSSLAAAVAPKTNFGNLLNCWERCKFHKFTHICMYAAAFYRKKSQTQEPGQELVRHAIVIVIVIHIVSVSVIVIAMVKSVYVGVAECCLGCRSKLRQVPQLGLLMT